MLIAAFADLSIRLYTQQHFPQPAGTGIKEWILFSSAFYHRKAVLPYQPQGIPIWRRYSLYLCGVFFAYYWHAAWIWVSCDRLRYNTLTETVCSRFHICDKELNPQQANWRKLFSVKLSLNQSHLPLHHNSVPRMIIITIFPFSPSSFHLPLERFSSFSWRDSVGPSLVFCSAWVSKSKMCQRSGQMSGKATKNPPGCWPGTTIQAPVDRGFVGLC